MSEFRFRELVDAGWLLVNDGYRAKVNELGGGGDLFLRAGALQDDGFRWSGLDSFTAEAKIEGKRGRAGDVVITTKGNSVGRVGWVPQSAPGFVYSPHLSFWRSLDHNRVVPRYLYYWSRSRSFAEQLRNLAFGTDMAPYLSLRDQLGLRINLPEAAQQRRIAGALGALDDLIETNRALAKHLDQIAAAASARFMSSVADRKAVPLSHFCSATKGFSYRSSELAEGPDILVNLKNVGRRGTFERRGFKRLNSDRYKEAQVVVPGDLIVSMTDLTQAREVVARPVRVPAAETTGRMVASLDLAIVRPENGYSREFLTAALAQEDFHKFALGYCNGTTVVHLSGRVFEDYQLPDVTPDETGAITAFLSTLNAQSDACTSEIDELTRARDELLPLLMSGRVRVREVA